jgi:ribosome-associated translation inhibitor RaiA
MHVHTHISKVTTFDNIEIHIHVHTHIPVETKFDNIEIHMHVHTSEIIFYQIKNNFLKLTYFIISLIWQ